MSVQPIDQWLSYLAALINPAFPGDAVEALARMRDALAEEFTPNTFSAMSARCVAQAERYGLVPDFGIISKALREYRRTFIPREQLVLTAPRIGGMVHVSDAPREQPTDAERAAMAEKAAKFHREMATARKPTTAGKPTPAYVRSDILSALYERDNLPDPRALKSEQAA